MARSLVPVSVVGCCSVPWFVYSVVGCGLGWLKGLLFTVSLNFKKEGAKLVLIKFSQDVFFDLKKEQHNCITNTRHCYICIPIFHIVNVPCCKLFGLQGSW